MNTPIPTPTFFARDIPIYGDVMLAPMDGYSDAPFRALCTEFGSAMSYTEFISAESLLHPAVPDTMTQRKLQFDSRERVRVVQIYGHEEETLVRAAQKLQDQQAMDILDLNLGCAVRDIAARGAGAGMLREPAKIARVMARLTRAVRVPVTAKMRLGWDERTRNYLEVARILEENGASLIAVHARTKAQGYSGTADWDAIAEIKQAVKIPVIGNGDVKTIADIARLKSHTGCDGVMIGRAAIGNPWIFARRERTQIAPHEWLAVVKRHLTQHLEFYGIERGLILFRKHAYRYVQGEPGAAALRHTLMLCNDVHEFERLLEEFAGTRQNSVDQAETTGE